MSDKSKIYYIPEGSPVVPSEYDLRVIDRLLSNGKLTRANYEKHLASLPDEAGNCDEIAFGDMVNDEEVLSGQREKETSPEPDYNDFDPDPTATH